MALTPEIQYALFDEDSDARVYLANYSGLIPDLQRKFVDRNVPVELNNLADNPVLIPELQLILAKHDSSSVRVWLSKNPALTDEAQLILIDEFPSIEYRVSPGPKTKAYLEMREILDR